MKANYSDCMLLFFPPGGFAFLDVSEEVVEGSRGVLRSQEVSAVKAACLSFSYLLSGPHELTIILEVCILFHTGHILSTETISTLNVMDSLSLQIVTKVRKGTTS